MHACMHEGGGQGYLGPTSPRTVLLGVWQWQCGLIDHLLGKHLSFWYYKYYNCLDLWQTKWMCQSLDIRNIGNNIRTQLPHSRSQWHMWVPTLPQGHRGTIMYCLSRPSLTKTSCVQLCKNETILNATQLLTHLQVLRYTMFSPMWKQTVDLSPHVPICNWKGSRNVMFRSECFLFRSECFLFRSECFPQKFVSSFWIFILARFVGDHSDQNSNLCNLCAELFRQNSRKNTELVEIYDNWTLRESV